VRELRVGTSAGSPVLQGVACRPSVVVLDEPATGLDVTTQTLVLRTVAELTAEHGVAALYITHDLAVVASIAHRVAVMRGGEIVEYGDVQEVLRSPKTVHIGRWR
jgi:peptide/nickel transport system ATP-binding protein